MSPAGHLKALGRRTARRGGTCWQASRIGKTPAGWSPFLVLSSVRAIPFDFRKSTLLHLGRHVAVGYDRLPRSASLLPSKKGAWATPQWGMALFAALTEPALRFRPMRVTIAVATPRPMRKAITDRSADRPYGRLAAGNGHGARGRRGGHHSDVRLC